MSIEAGGAFSGKLESIDGLKLNNRAEIHINKYYQGIITLYRVSRKIVNMAQEKIEYLVIKLENEEKITAIGLNFKSASGGVNNCFKLELQADILLKGKMAYANTSKFQEIYFEITEGNELIGLCPYDVNKNYEDIIFCRKIDIPINVENRSVQLENGELIFGVYPKYQYSKEALSIGFAHRITWKFNSAIDIENIRENLYIITDFFSVLAGESVTINAWYCRNDNSGNAKSSNCMGNATWKNDYKYFRKWIIDSYGFIPCSFYLWIVYSPNGEKRLSNTGLSN